jgi:hypothetical protein
MRKADREAGRIVAMVPMASLAALLCVGLGVDFSGQTLAEQQLRDQAGYCAREGSNQITMGATSTVLAVAQAQNCLARTGTIGTVFLSGRNLVVEVRGSYDTKLLSILMINRLPLKGTATMQIMQGR